MLNMLSSLHIENIAVIEKAEIELGFGLNILTGETGAGKSIVIDAINAVLGERVSKDIVRTGSGEARITAVFTDISEKNLRQLNELGYPADEDGSLLIQRTISADGRGGCRINGQPSTISMLRTIGRMLVNIHGQHENQSLLSPETHLFYLEQIGGIVPLHEEYRRAYREMCRIKELLEQSKMDEGLKARKIDILQFQINEIEAAQIRPGEEEELSAQRDLYRNAEKIAVAISGAREQLLGGDGSAGALELLSDAVSQVNFAGQYVESMAELGKKLESLMYDLEEYSGELRDFFSQLDFEPDDLEQVEERLDLIRRLKSKYGGSEQAVLDYLEQAKKELEEIELSDVRIEQLNGELKRAESMVNELAKKLSDERRKAAKKFEQNVNEQLNYLDMPNVRFSVDIRPIEPGPNGIDRVEFLIAPNPGEPPKPIARIASGGELSRIMLALKSVMADADDIDTLIFDEIDSGISGMAASKIGIKLREISEKRQVICVTHLAQISAQARNHFLIVKNVRGGRTYTDVLPLDYQGRVKELARIIGGVISEAALQTAREMLSNAGWN
ncbi:MAG TPA: DNA repair protein RecN [Candidatus Avimonas sp.]|jgi:DNA repair protein RecN (Recombination protein N)|nr:DNA repair protein RecN [Candidatus Avimonas sp.]HQA16013.1 DNA repair protein RecN [Candidatus Avimonas sp.]HQD38116.1 DNA repair protein RecN [Candidatus Avimonas sp.]